MNEYVPTVTPQLINHLRNDRKDWRNAMPEANWTHDQIQRAIGANEVILHLEELLNRQSGLVSDDDD
ncbi:hypothetical protein [Rhizobium sp. 18065]|uniref:hypothetical protein n=1 Tax=Rhizobium sp. 18065 TaxID=2681411 RepID=UPI001358D35B|nr:hypothetical protein [Rhizobium sp. 18065]